MRKLKLMTIVMAAVAACGGGGDSPVTPPGGTSGDTTSGTQTATLGMSLSASTLSVQKGAGGTVTVTIVRGGGLTASTELSLEGAPTGVTGSFAPASLTGTVLSSTLTISAAAAAAAGNATLTVRAKASGVADKTASLALTVAAAPAAGSYTLSATPAAVSMAQGGSGASTINVARTNSFAGAVALAVTGAPTGLTATLGTPSVTGNSSSLSLAAAASTTPGTYTLTITGTATGLANQTTTVAVTVSQAQTSTGNVTWGFCPTNTPVWFAAQDGSSSWTRVNVGVSNDFKFSINSATGGVAYVTNNNGSFTMNVFYGTQQELTAQGAGLCVGGASKTLTGMVAGISGTDAATIAMGGAAASASPTTTAFTLAGVAGGTQDLLATDAALSFSGTSVLYLVKKMIIRRNLNLTNNAVIPTLDFNAAEAFAPATATLTLANTGSDQTAASTIYSTANGSAGAIANDISGGASRTIYGVPAAKQAAGDLHGLVASAFTLSGTSVTQLRIATVFFKDLANKTLTLGSAPSAATVTSVSTTPVARLRAQWAVQSEYNKNFVVVYGQAVGSTARSISMSASAGYLGGSPSSIDLTMPDLSTVAGWDSNWGLRAGTATTWATNASGWNYTGTSTSPVDAGVILAGQRMGTITP